MGTEQKVASISAVDIGYKLAIKHAIEKLEIYIEAGKDSQDILKRFKAWEKKTNE